MGQFGDKTDCPAFNPLTFDIVYGKIDTILLVEAGGGNK